MASFRARRASSPRKANHLLAIMLGEALGRKATADNLCVSFLDPERLGDLELRRAIANLAASDSFSWERLRKYGSSASSRLTKFQPCLPEPLELDLIVRGTLDIEGARKAVAAGCAA